MARMSAKVMVLEFGMGVDVHGNDVTKAACRGVSDAIRHSSLPLFQDVRARGGRMLVAVTVGVPDPGKVDVERVRASCRTARSPCTRCSAACACPAADTIIACVAITVSVDSPRERVVTTTTSGIGLTRLQHLVLWVSDVERSVRFYRDVLGLEVRRRYPNAAFLIIPGTPDDHHLGLFQQPGVGRRTRASRACITPRGRSARSPTSSPRSAASPRRARSSARPITASASRSTPGTPTASSSRSSGRGRTASPRRPAPSTSWAS